MQSMWTLMAVTFGEDLSTLSAKKKQTKKQHVELPVKVTQNISHGLGSLLPISV